MIFRIRFAKYGVVKFIGHLDVMRYFQKAVRRSGLPIKYSQGFNPHQLMVFAQPLGVGVTSDGEYMDIETEDNDFEGNPLNAERVREILGGALTEGFEIVSIREVPWIEGTKHPENAMALVKGPWTIQKSGVWIDIFPLDGVVNQKEYSRRYNRLKRISSFVYKFRRQNHHIVSSDSLWSKTKTHIARIIGLNGRLPYAVLRHIVSVMTRYGYEDSDFYGQMSCLDDGPIMFDRKGFNDTVLLDFEDTKLRAMSGYEEVLHQLYGDYMQLPPEEKRSPKQYWIHFLWK